MRSTLRVLLPLSLVLNLLFAAAWLLPLSVTTAQTDSRYFPETHHYIKGQFLKYWTDHGGLAQQGYPLTEEFQEKNKLNGQTYTVQYFERAIFEKHPENQPPFDVLLSQLGKFELDARYPNNSNPAAASQPPPTGSAPTATPAPQPTQPSAGGQRVSGHGQNLSDPVQLHVGLAVFHAVHTNGTRNFIVELVDTSGKSVALLANTIGPADLSAAAQITTAGQYLLKVEADGDWTIEVSQPSAVYSAPPATQTWRGHGTQVTPLFSLKTGGARFHAIGTGGTRNFIVTLYKGDGSLADLIANKIGPSDVSTIYNVASNGVYLLQVQYEGGDWEITVQQ